MNMGYISVQHTADKCHINWKELEKEEIIEKTEFVKHIRFKEDIKIQTDGKKRIAVIERGTKTVTQ